jgi:hypothetical protein
MKIEIELVCLGCGMALETVDAILGKYRVKPCPWCLKEAEDQVSELRDDDVASLRSDLADMVEQNRILSEQIHFFENEAD